ncbi:hypothetical protein ABIB80_007534 [Bradyrhizobium sp. i1.15.2]
MPRQILDPSPDPPPRLADGPLALEEVSVALRIYRVPEAVMNIRAQILTAGELLHGLALPDHAVARDQVTDRRRQQEESAVDPAAVIAWLLLELTTRSPSIAIAATRLAGRTTETAGPAPVRPMKGYLGVEIDVGDVAAIGQRKKGVIRDIGQHPLRLAAVWALSSVSTSMTRQGSAVSRWTSIRFSARWKVTSDMCSK